MKRLLKLTLLTMVAAAAVVYVAGRRPSQAAAAESASANPHAEHMMTMTPEEHVRMMAGAATSTPTTRSMNSRAAWRRARR